MGSSAMKISDALRWVRQLAFDTSPKIYLVENHRVYFDRMFSIMSYIHNRSVDGVGSVLALTEVLVHPQRSGNVILAQEYEQIMLTSAGFRLVPVDVSVARRAAHLRAHHNLRTPDAIHATTALVSGCDAFLMQRCITWFELFS
jgi:predicted nucleic acid-binding protein